MKLIMTLNLFELWKGIRVCINLEIADHRTAR